MSNIVIVKHNALVLIAAIITPYTNTSFEIRTYWYCYVDANQSLMFNLALYYHVFTLTSHFVAGRSFDRIRKLCSKLGSRIMTTDYILDIELLQISCRFYMNATITANLIKMSS